MKIGFDIDGVISRQRTVKSAEECLNAERSSLKLPSNKHEVYLVSARSANMRKATEKWLAENGVEYEELYLYDGSFGCFEDIPKKEFSNVQSLFKSSVINKLGLNVFVEDRSAVREQIKSICPDCRVLSPSQFKSEKTRG